MFFSTHILGDVERVCDTVAILDRGKLITESNLSELRSKYARTVFVIEIDGPAGTLKEKLEMCAWVEQVKEDGRQLIVTVSDLSKGQMEIARVIAETGMPLREFKIAEPTLEDIFVELVGER